MPGDRDHIPNRDRRRTLKWLAAASAAIAAVLAGVPVLRVFLFPAFRRPEGRRWFKLGDAASFPAGVPTRVDVPETVTDAWVENRVLRTVWVYTEDGTRFVVYNGRCTHLGCSYRFDQAPDPRYHRAPNVFHCPCHHGIFDPKTGGVLAGPPPRPLDTLETKLEGGTLFVAYENFRVGIAKRVTV
jgi:menaquinol-cytochrome c reductase iron-sulfur subunit